MSLICIGFTDVFDDTEKVEYTASLAHLAGEHGAGISFSVDWSEPIVNCYSRHNCLLFSLTDAPDSSNCEMLLLPDNWVYNGKASSESFLSRMACIIETSNYITSHGHRLDLYIGESGTEYDEYDDMIIDAPCNPEELAEKIISVYTSGSVHLSISHYIDN